MLRGLQPNFFKIFDKNPIIGTILPIMGIKNANPPPRASLADALFPKVRQRVLAVMFDAPQSSFYMAEVIALAHSGTGAVQRELAGLAAAGLLTVHKRGKQKHYQANAQTPVFDALCAVVRHSIGVHNVLRVALEPLGWCINAACVYDEPPAARAAAPGAVTLVLFGVDLANPEGASSVSVALQGASNTLARQVSFTLHTPETLASAVAQDPHYLNHLMQVPKTWLMGSEDQLFAQPT